MLFFRKKPKKATVYIDGKKHVINLNKTPEQREKEYLEFRINMFKGDLVEIFRIKNEKELKELERKIFLPEAMENKDMTLEERYKAIRIKMSYQDELKQFCYAHGVEGNMYFEKNWLEIYDKTTKRYNEIKEKMGK